MVIGKGPYHGTKRIVGVDEISATSHSRRRSDSVFRVPRTAIAASCAVPFADPQFHSHDVQVTAGRRTPVPLGVVASPTISGSTGSAGDSPVDARSAMARRIPR